MTDLKQHPANLAPDAGTRPRRSTVVLLGVIVVALVVAAGAVGWLVRGGNDNYVVKATSVDAGFARDMATHHTQATIMAGYARDHTDNGSVRNLAYDIETAQYSQVGEMTGWLDAWGLSRSSTVPLMSWMGDDAMTAMMTSGDNDGALMPGMATTTELNRLLKSTGTQLDVLFLQLMIRHHEGGVDMAKYAAAHAHFGYVRRLAQSMVDNQSTEISQMTTLLKSMGGSPLPFG